MGELDTENRLLGIQSLGKAIHREIIRCITAPISS